IGLFIAGELDEHRRTSPATIKQELSGQHAFAQRAAGLAQHANEEVDGLVRMSARLLDHLPVRRDGLELGIPATTPRATWSLAHPALLVHALERVQLALALDRILRQANVRRPGLDRFFRRTTLALSRNRQWNI